MRHRLLLFLSIILLSSCIEEIVYEQAQPEQSKDQKRFKSKFRGKYYGDSGCYTFEVKKKKIIGHWKFEGMVHKDNVPLIELDINKEAKEKVNYKVVHKGDSALVKATFKETIFAISDKQKLRYHEGVYFLNYMDTNNYADTLQLWSIKTLALDGDEIQLGHLPASEEYVEDISRIFPLKEIKDEDDDTIGYQAAPTMEEWSRFIRKKAYKVDKSFSVKKTKASCDKFSIEF